MVTQISACRLTLVDGNARYQFRGELRANALRLQAELRVSDAAGLIDLEGCSCGDGCGIVCAAIFSRGKATKPAWATLVFTAAGADGTPVPVGVPPAGAATTGATAAIRAALSAGAAGATALPTLASF